MCNMEILGVLMDEQINGESICIYNDSYSIIGGVQKSTLSDIISTSRLSYYSSDIAVEFSNGYKGILMVGSYQKAEEVLRRIDNSNNVYSA